MKTTAERVDEALADGMEWFKPLLTELIKAAVAEERARCATIAHEFPCRTDDCTRMSWEIAEAIAK